MKNSPTFSITAHGERGIVIMRIFDAPRQLVFDAYTNPELVKKWLLGPDGWSMPVCEIDLRVGGKYRYVWKSNTDGREMGMGGVYREVLAPERIVATELFDEAWYPGEAVDTMVLVERQDHAYPTHHLQLARDARCGTEVADAVRNGDELRPAGTLLAFAGRGSESVVSNSIFVRRRYAENHAVLVVRR
jgi:uncharacterized protein YndB with AHSA1/START domain